MEETFHSYTPIQLEDFDEGIKQKLFQMDSTLVGNKLNATGSINLTDCGDHIRANYHKCNEIVPATGSSGKVGVKDFEFGQTKRDFFFLTTDKQLLRYNLTRSPNSKILCNFALTLKKNYTQIKKGTSFLILWSQTEISIIFDDSQPNIKEIFLLNQNQEEIQYIKDISLSSVQPFIFILHGEDKSSLSLLNIKTKEIKLIQEFSETENSIENIEYVNFPRGLTYLPEDMEDFPQGTLMLGTESYCSIQLFEIFNVGTMELALQD